MVPLRLTCLHPSAYLSVLSVFKSPSYLTGLKNFQLLAPACAQKSFQHSATRGPCVRDFQAEVSQGCHVMLVACNWLLFLSTYLCCVWGWEQECLRAGHLRGGQRMTSGSQFLLVDHVGPVDVTPGQP